MGWVTSTTVRRYITRIIAITMTLAGMASVIGITTASVAGAAVPTLVAGPTVPVGSRPMFMGYDSVNGYVYIPNELVSSTGVVETGTVTVFNPVTNQVVTTIPDMGLGPASVAVDSATNIVYVLDKSGGNFYAINGATNVASGPFSTGGTAQEIGATVDLSNNTLYIGGGAATGDIEAVDMSTNAVTATFTPSVSTDTLFAISYDSSNNTLYASDVSNNTLYSIDPTNNTTTGSTALTANSSAIWITVDSAANELFVSEPGTNQVQVISTDAALSGSSIVTTITGITYAAQSVLSDGALFVDESTASQFAEINLTNLSGTPILYPTGSGSEPAGIAYSGSEWVVGDLAKGVAYTYTTGIVCTSNAGGSGTTGSNNECLNIKAGQLSVGSVNPSSLSSVVAGSTSGDLPSAVWSDATGSGAGWSGTLALSSFSYTGAWNTSSGANALGTTAAGSYTGTADGLMITCTVGSGATTTSTPFTWVDNQGGSGSGTATNGTAAAIEDGVTIDFSASITYVAGNAFVVDVGTQAASALELDTAAAGVGIAPAASVTSPAPTFENNTTAVVGGGPATVGTAVPMVVAAATTGMGSYTVVPGASVVTDSNSWAATYTAQAQYSIATGP